MKLSIVGTLYKSSPYIHEFYHRSRKAASSLFGNDFEIIFVNDGSPDDSLQKAIELSQSDANVKVVNLSRNFGHHNAILAGLSEASGEVVFLIDTDLEEEPEWLHLFHKQIGKGWDVVYGSQQIKRKGGYGERLFGWIFWNTFFKLTKLPVQDSPVIARLMTKNYVSALLTYKEKNFFFGGVCAHVGFRQVGIPVNKKDKKQSTYSFILKLTLALNALIAFTAMPLLLLSIMGLFMAMAGILMFADILYSKLTGTVLLAGWSSIMASIWFLFGVLTTSVSVVGIYLVKVYDEVKERPRFIIKEVIQGVRK
jgi:putative glycosyltransferase